MTEQSDQNGAEALELAPAHSSLRPVQLAWKHKGLVSLGVVLGGVLGALYYVQAKPVYQSGAQVLVIKKRPEALPMAGNDARLTIVEDYLATHQVLIKSPLIVSDAVREGKLHDLESFGGEDPTGKIIEALKITREVRENQPTNILNITCRSPISADCGVIVNAVIESYHKFLNRTYQNVSDDTARLITQARDILENKLSGTEDKYRKFRLDHPILWKNKEGVSVVQDRLQSIEAKRSGLLVRQSEIEGRIALFKKTILEKRSREELLAMVALSTGRLAAEAGKTPTAEDPLTALILQEQTLQEDYGPDYPQLKSLRKRIALLRGQRDREGRSGDDTPADPVKAHLNLLEREAEDARIGAEGLAKLLKNEQEEAKKLVNYENLDDSYRTEISRNQQLFESISKRLTEVNLLKDFGGFECQSISPAVNGWKVAPKPIPIFVVAGFMGLLMGFGLAYLSEISDQSFRTPDEIRHRLGLPLIGHIPFFEPKESALGTAGQEGPKLNPILVTALRSKSREAEAYRVVRTSLFFSSRSGGHKVIQVTSPDVGDGKSTLAANLAVSIAQSGKAVLVIDCDFRRPRIHKIFDVKATRGLASVILGEAELADVIQASAIAGLSVLPCGPIPNNPAELLTQPRLKELLAELREKYDFVLIDTPPLLAVTDPSVVAPHVDGIIMTVRISKNGRTHAQRAKEILATLGANVLGVVVNGVGRGAEGYGYDKYHYGYSYKSYEYAYSNGDEDAYYKQDGTDGQDATEDQKSRTGHRSRGFFGRLFNR
jgi:succinoglycan biosynthesis transport protein ExoP